MPTALQHHGARLEDLHDLRHDRVKQVLEGTVICAIPHGHVERVILSMGLSNVFNVTRPREEVVAVLVEADRQHPAVSEVVHK